MNTSETIKTLWNRNTHFWGSSIGINRRYNSLQKRMKFGRSDKAINSNLFEHFCIAAASFVTKPIQIFGAKRWIRCMQAVRSFNTENEKTVYFHHLDVRSVEPPDFNLQVGNIHSPQNGFWLAAIWIYERHWFLVHFKNFSIRTDFCARVGGLLEIVEQALSSEAQWPEMAASLNTCE